MCRVHCQMNIKISDSHITNSMELSATQNAICCVTAQEILSILWNLGGGSSPHSQELSTCPYPEPEQSSPYHHSKINLNVIHHLHLGLTSPNGLLPSGFPINTFFPLLPHLCYMPCSSHPKIEHSNHLKGGCLHPVACTRSGSGLLNKIFKPVLR
jgi:hypothetical protein